MPIKLNTPTKTKEDVKTTERVNITINNKIEIKTPKNYHVIMLNNEDTFFDAVADVLHHIFNHNRQTSMRLVMQCHEVGQVSVLTTTKDIADQKIEEAHAYCLKKAAEGHTVPGLNRSMFYESMRFDKEEVD